MFKRSRMKWCFLTRKRGWMDGVYILDEIGARIWQLIEQFGDIALKLPTSCFMEYDVDAVHSQCSSG